MLFGQPELDTVLEDASIRQLRQRISFSYEILPLSKIGMSVYIDHRLAVAGYTGPNLFADKVMDVLYRGSGGVPRLANILAHKALMATFGDGSARVKVRHVKDAIGDTIEARRYASPALSFRRRPLSWVFGGLGASITVVTLVSLYITDVLAVLP